MNKQYFVALCLLVTVATSYGMKFTDTWWAHLLNISGRMADYGSPPPAASWETIRHGSPKLKDEAGKRLFSISKPSQFAISKPSQYGWPGWETAFNSAVNAGVNFKKVKFPDNILEHVKDPTIVKLLIQNGAKTNIYTPKEGNLLHQAFAVPTENLLHQDFAKTQKLVQLYLENQVDPDAQDANGDTPLHVLVMNARDASCYANADLLIKAPRGKSILMPNNKGVTPLELAYQHMFEKMKNKKPQEYYIIPETLKNKMKKRVQEESYAQETGYKEEEFLGQYATCKERIKKLKEKQKEVAPRSNKGNNFSASPESLNGYDKKTD